MIPKIIHQTWKNENIPYDTFKKEWIESWTNLNPTWQFKLWTDMDIKNFLEDKFPWFMDRFNEYPKNIQRVDAFRYFADFRGLPVGPTPRKPPLAPKKATKTHKNKQTNKTNETNN